MGAGIGVVSSFTALFIGCLFFLYALKYYSSTIIALSSVGNTKSRKKIHDIEEPKSNEELPFISVHLPFYNEANVARRVIKACLELNYPNFEILIADDSRDETVKILKELDWHKWPPTIKLIHRNNRLGYKGGALNEALRFMNPRAEFVVVFDADFIPSQDILKRFLEKFTEFDPLLVARKNPPNPNMQNYKPVAAIQGYQQHYLNKSENWVTRGVRAEFSGSYMVERVVEEKLGAMKMVSGSVFMLRADVLRELQWGNSITEDWELTIRLYLKGYKVVYTPLIQAPAEIPTTIKALTKQRMRWAEGHTHVARRYFFNTLTSKKLTLAEKLEFLYFVPYYLQSLMLLVGSVCWLISEINHAYPWFWRPVFGWSLLISNLMAIPIMCSAGLWLEGDLRSDSQGIFSLVVLTYILAPFQGYSALKGLLENDEGAWIRTLKTGSITDRFLSVKFRRLITWVASGISLRRVNPLGFQFPSVEVNFRLIVVVLSFGLMLLPFATAFSLLVF